MKSTGWTFLLAEYTDAPKLEDRLGSWDLGFGINLRSGAIDADDGASCRPAQKRAFDERIDHHPRRLVIEAPQPRRLRQRQLQTRHLVELTSHAVHDSM